MSAIEDLRAQILSQKPTNQQTNAIFAEESEFILRAAPGSGKTWTSCRRFIWRGANRQNRIGGLALLSFTNTAIREFQAATVAVGRSDLLSEPNYTGTFDAFVERFIISPFGHLEFKLLRRPRLFHSALAGQRNNKGLHAWLELKGGRKLPVPAWEIVPILDGKKLAFKSSNDFGGQPIDGRSALGEFWRLGFYTHAQRVYFACRLLIKRPHLAQLLARRFEEIIVDEAQDTNVWLIVLLNLLREKGTKVTLIGDPDQCIYEFSMADATSLTELKEKWGIPEMPLSQSFRCNDRIAETVRNIGGNLAFAGSGQPVNDHCRAFIVKEPSDKFATCVARFADVAEAAGIPERSSAIICRAHSQLAVIRGENNFAQLKGVTLEFARAAFHRDCLRDYKTAFAVAYRSLREISNAFIVWTEVDESPDSDKALQTKRAVWRFVKNHETGLPPVDLNGTTWITQIRASLGELLHDMGVDDPPNLNVKIKKTGLDEDQMGLPLFAAEPLFPAIRQETIHQVKGESIDAVLVLGSCKFWNSIVDSIARNVTNENRRLAYVAMTRARHVLVVGLPAAHFDKYAARWTDWGFQIL